MLFCYVFFVVLNQNGAAADKASEAVCVSAIQSAFPDHLILGEEGGIIGTGESDYLWYGTHICCS